MLHQSNEEENVKPGNMDANNAGLKMFLEEGNALNAECKQNFFCFQVNFAGLLFPLYTYYVGLTGFAKTMISSCTGLWHKQAKIKNL